MPTPRGKLATELRDARLAAGFTSHEALSARMGVDRTLVTRAESASAKPPSDVTLNAWAKHTGVNAGRWLVMAEVCRTATDGVPGWIEDYLRAEGVAPLLRYWSPGIMPALFHTANYARALLLAAQTDTSAENIEPLVTAKLARAEILERPDAPEVIAVIHEPVLYKPIAPSDAMHEQLMHVAELSERPNVSVLIVPSDAGATAGESGAMNLATGCDGLADTLHTDAIPEGHTSDSPATVRQALVAFERVRGLAHPRALSRQIIREVADERWKTQ